MHSSKFNGHLPDMQRSHGMYQGYGMRQSLFSGCSAAYHTSKTAGVQSRQTSFLSWEMEKSPPIIKQAPIRTGSFSLQDYWKPATFASTIPFVSLKENKEAFPTGRLLGE